LDVEHLSAACLPPALLHSLGPRSVKAAESRIEILVNEPIGKISPEIYSHFIEHLGAVIYDGIWWVRNRRFRITTVFEKRWLTI
jgi:alpha-N-arabinofuranosidase